MMVAGNNLEAKRAAATTAYRPASTRHSHSIVLVAPPEAPCLGGLGGLGLTAQGVVVVVCVCKGGGGRRRRLVGRASGTVHCR